MRTRCSWVGESPLMIKYHDTEWGVPVHDDKKLFEFFVLDTFQAGLSWEIILNKRQNFKKAFVNFDAKKIAKFEPQDVRRLLKDKTIIRNKLKIEATVNNARRFLEIQKELGSFSKYIWRFVGHRPIKNNYKKDSHTPARTAESEKMSKDLKKRGFKFVGPTICYAFMQGAGLVNDHTTNCFLKNNKVKINK